MRKGKVPRMKRFLLQLLLFACTYLAVRSVIEWVVPYDKGNDFFEKKLEILEEQALKPAVLFMGTSRVQAQIDPVFFDSVVVASGCYEGVSYNLGVFLTPILESIHLTRNVLRSEAASRCKTVFIELNIQTNINIGLLKDKERACYWLDPSKYMVLSKVIVAQNGMSAGQKLNHLSGLTRLLFNRYFGLDRFRTFILKETNVHMIPLESHVRGYMSLDEEYAKFAPDYLKDFRASFDTSLLRSNKSQMELGQMKEGVLESNALSEYLNGFIDEAARSGVQIVFISMPSYRNGLETLVSRNLKPGHYINLADPVTYPAFFEPSSYFDNTHLNQKGARILTGVLAEAYAGFADPVRRPLKRGMPE